MNNTNDKELVLQAILPHGLEQGRPAAGSVGGNARHRAVRPGTVHPGLSGGPRHAEYDTRNAGRENGFVCRSTAGRVVRLIQNYDSDKRPGEPETLPAQWGFVWSTDPDKALPNVWSPDTYPQGWTELGPVGGPFVEEDA